MFDVKALKFLDRLSKNGNAQEVLKMTVNFEIYRRRSDWPKGSTMTMALAPLQQNGTF